MSGKINRRKFLKNSFIAGAGAVSALSIEERILLAEQEEKEKPKPSTHRPPKVEVPEGAVTGLQTGKIGNVTISRLICGGNLISGYAHSRDLIYVSNVMKHYFTDEKIFETLQICEANGINTALLRLDDKTIKILDTYWKERGGKIQWLAQIKPTELDLTSDAKKAIDNGAIGVLSHGGVGNSFFNNGKIALLGKMVEFAKENKVIVGIGGHVLDVIMAAEDEGLEPDFYFKTFNTAGYECSEPQKISQFMENVKKPWIAFKVLGAGVTHPSEGLKYAFDNGADFAVVGMFDFQVKEDIVIAKQAIEAAQKRQRPWTA
jgi:hypothetical protein